MRRAVVRLAAAVLVSELVLSASMAQEVDGDYHSVAPPKSSWFSGWFNWGKSNSPKPDPKKTIVTAADAAQAPTLDLAAIEQKREEKALWRRLDVCHKLMQIADEKDDDVLRRQATELEDRAFEVYKQRMVRLGGRPGASETDEGILGRKSGDGSDKLQGPGSGDANSRAASMRGDNR